MYQSMAAIARAVNTGTGMNRNEPAIVLVKDGGRPKTGLAPEMIRVRPRKIALVPRVMMKGCRPVKLTSKPLTAPSAKPTPTPPISTASVGSTPATIIR